MSMAQAWEATDGALPQEIADLLRNSSDVALHGPELLLAAPIINSNRFQSGCGSRPNKSLQADWNGYGSESFASEVLDELTATEGPARDYRADLASLEELWLERLEPYNERGYDQKKKGSEESLKEMAQKRSRLQ
jgi:hypothetical protein